MSLNSWFKNILGESLIKSKDAIIQENQDFENSQGENIHKEDSKKEDSKEDEEIIDMQKDYAKKMQALLDIARNKKDTKTFGQGIEEFSQIKRELQIKDISQKIKRYDDKKTNQNPKYVNFFNQKEKEENPEVTEALDIILEKKLDVFKGVEQETEESKKQLEKQKEEYEKRQKEYNNRISLIKNSIKNYDSAKKKDNEQYKTFDEVCLDSDWDDVDEDMHINLQEKLNVYDESKEDEKTRLRRTEKLKKLDVILKKYEEEKLNASYE